MPRRKPPDLDEVGLWFADKWGRPKKSVRQLDSLISSITLITFTVACLHCYSAVLGFRTSGVNTNVAATKIVNEFWQIEEEGSPWHFGEYKSRLMGVPRRPPCQNTLSNCSDPISADPSIIIIITIMIIIIIIIIITIIIDHYFYYYEYCYYDDHQQMAFVSLSEAWP